MKNILITGGLGFIGSNLAIKCVQFGYNVTIISKTKTKLYNIRGFENNINVIYKDIKNIDIEVKDMDYIFHCASTVDNYNIFDNPYIDIDVNVTGTVALLEACRRYNTSVEIIYTSTFFVNGNANEFPVTPNTKENPLGVYGATKLCAENILKTYHSVFGIKCKIARLSNVFGLGEQSGNNKKAAFNKMIYTAVEGIHPIRLYDNGVIKRDYIYIDDVISALITIMKNGNNEIYYIGRGESIKFKKLVDIIIEKTNNAKLEIVESPPFHKQVGINDFECDISSLKSLGWKPLVSIEDGIKRVVQQYNTELCNAK